MKGLIIFSYPEHFKEEMSNFRSLFRPQTHGTFQKVILQPGDQIAILTSVLAVVEILCVFYLLIVRRLALDKKKIC